MCTMSGGNAWTPSIEEVRKEDSKFNAIFYYTDFKASLDYERSYLQTNKTSTS